MPGDREKELDLSSLSEKKTEETKGENWEKQGREMVERLSPKQLNLALRLIGRENSKDNLSVDFSGRFKSKEGDDIKENGVYRGYDLSGSIDDHDIRIKHSEDGKIRGSIDFEEVSSEITESLYQQLVPIGEILSRGSKSDVHHDWQDFGVAKRILKEKWVEKFTKDIFRE